jgi:succinyl-CoA synthetase alpha subunit
LTISILDVYQGLVGAASDKVAALERAGAIVTQSPAQIGTEMVKVSSLTS